MPIAVDECYRVLEEIRAGGIAILLVEQNTERVLRAADRIMVLESGRLAWSGSGTEAIGNASIVGSYLGLEPE
jgi:branched-chain amino acid transport system ATP-binding protein